MNFQSQRRRQILIFQIENQNQDKMILMSDPSVSFGGTATVRRFVRQFSQRLTCLFSLHLSLICPFNRGGKY